MVFCTKCGKAVADDAQFCPECGEKIVHSENDVPTNDLAAAESVQADTACEEINPPKMRTGMKIAMIICFVFAGFFTIFSFGDASLLAGTCLFGIPGFMFLILAKSPKENKKVFENVSLFKKSNGMPKGAFVGLSIFLALFLFVSIINASSGSPTQADEREQSTGAAVQKAETNEGSVSDTTKKKTEDDSYGLNDTATLKKLKITATELEESYGKNYIDAESGKIFVGVKFEIENISDETQAMSSLLLFDAYADDVKCSYSLSANVVFGDGTLDGEVSPGKKLVGWYAVEVPQDWQKLELEIQSSWLSSKKAKFVFTK